MKVKMQVGAEFDIISKKEMQDLLDQHRRAMEGGKVFRNRGGAQLVIAAGTFADLDGPPDGYSWELKRATVIAAGGTTVELHYDDASTSSNITGTMPLGLNTYTSKAIIVHSGSRLVLVNTGVASSTTVINLGVVQVKSGEEWRF